MHDGVRGQYPVWGCGRALPAAVAPAGGAADRCRHAAIGIPPHGQHTAPLPSGNGELRGPACSPSSFRGSCRRCRSWLAVALIAFALFAFVGDPVTIMLGQDYTEAQRPALVTRLGLDQPFFVQFAHSSGHAAAWRVRPSPTGWRARSPNSSPNALPATLELAFCAAAARLCSACRWASIPGSTATPGSAALFLAVQPDRRVAADLPDRHPADPGLRGRGSAGCPSSAAATVVQLGWWTTGFLTRRRAQGADPAVDHARPVPDDADHAAGARGDAGGAAHRLHQVRARPRPDQPRDQFRPRAEEHAGAGDHHHRPAARRRSSPSRSSPRRCSSGRAWGCCSSRRCRSPISRSWRPI